LNIKQQAVIIDLGAFFIYYESGVKNTLPLRLARLFADMGINQMDFARKTGFGQPYISQIMNGTKSSPSPRFFDIVCREFNVNPEWLKTGRGNMYTLPGGEQSENAEIMAKLHSLPKPEQRLIEDMINALLYKAIVEEKQKR
jgi:transcriptional regulator with XRE-family HTH domain